MIEQGTVDGQSAVLCYVNDAIEPVADKRDATLVVASLADGRKLFLKIPAAVTHDFDPSQPRDPDGKFAGSGAQPALAGAGGPHPASSLRSRIGSFIGSGHAKEAIASAATKAVGAAVEHRNELLAGAVTFGLYHIAGADFPIDVEAALHHEVEHLAQNLGVAKTMAVSMMKDAVSRLQGLRRTKDAMDAEDDIGEALAELMNALDELEQRYKAEEQRQKNGDGNHGRDT